MSSGLDKQITLPDGTVLTVGELERYAWQTGYFLEERLDPLQLEIDQIITNLKPRTREFLLLARKIGKTYGLLAYADKMARRNKNWIIRFAYPTETQGKTIILPIFNELQENCPPDLKWVNREAQEKCWILPHTGSRLYLAGTDSADQVDRLRGPRAHLIVLDELPTFKGNLTFLINSVLWPQVMTTGGHIIMSGTPPRTMDHESCIIIDQMRKKGRLITRTIFDNPRLSPETIRVICEEANPEASSEEVDAIMKGEKTGSPDWEREFLVKMVTDENVRVVPEFKELEHVGTCEAPRFTHRFVFLDPGHVKDFFAAVFVVLDFANQRLLVLREHLSKRKATDEILQELKKIETELKWGPDDNVLRFMDSTSQQQCTDFNSKGYYTQLAVKSPGKSGVVIEMRNRFNADQLIVSPLCKNLIAQLRDGAWKDTAKDDFERTTNLGHLDALDALAQGCMTLQALGKWHQNPAPKGVYQDPSGYHVNKVIQLADRRGEKQIQKAFRKVFSIHRQARS